MTHISTRRKNSLLLCKRIAEMFQQKYDKDGKRPEVIYEELSKVFCLTPDTVRNKRYDWLAQPEDVKRCMETGNKQLALL